MAVWSAIAQSALVGQSVFSAVAPMSYTFIMYGFVCVYIVPPSSRVVSISQGLLVARDKVDQTVEVLWMVGCCALASRVCDW